MKQLRTYLGAKGHLFPVTVKQIAAFKNFVEQSIEEEDIYPDPDVILAQDYREPKVHYSDQFKQEEDFREVVRYAARNGNSLPEEVLKLMRADRGE